MKALSDKQVRTFIDEFYTESLEDIVGLFSIAKEVGEMIEDEDTAREESLRVVDGLLKRGMQAGDSPYHPSGYQPWKDQDHHSILNRIRSEWLALGRKPNIPDIAWFGPPR